MLSKQIATKPTTTIKYNHDYSPKMNDIDDAAIFVAAKRHDKRLKNRNLKCFVLSGALLHK